MKQQVRVVLSISIQRGGEAGQEALRLLDIAEPPCPADLELLQIGLQPLRQHAPGLGLAALIEKGIGIAELLLPARIGPAVREVQITEQSRHRCYSVKLRIAWVHP